MKYGILQRPLPWWIDARANCLDAQGEELLRERNKSSRQAVGEDQFDKVNTWFKKEQSAGVPKSFLTKNELLKCVVYKMHRCSFRPAFKSRIEKDNTEEKVVQSTKSAFTKVSSILKSSSREKVFEVVLEAINHLNEMHGISFATSSAILSLVSTEVAFMSDEILREMVASPSTTTLKYDKAAFTTLWNVLDEKVRSLNAEQEKELVTRNKKRKADDDGLDDHEEKVLEVWTIRSLADVAWNYIKVENSKENLKQKVASQSGRKVSKKAYCLG